MSQKNGIPGNKKDSNTVRDEISYWKMQNNERKCTKFSEMSYWEIVSANSAL